MYAEHFGFTGPAFQLTPDPRFYFGSATHRKAMAYLGFGLAQGEGFIVITGEIGAGKTTLVGHLMATVDPARLTVAEVSSTQLGGDDMLRVAAQAFGVPAGDSKAATLTAVETFLRDCAAAGRKALLIVDEAQNLGHEALEELRMLCNLRDGGRALLQIFLLGQPEFRDRLEHEPRLEQLRQRVIATHHLDAMPASETEPYMRHRLQLVGWAGKPALSECAFAAIHRLSGGLPRRINTLASRVLLQAAVEGVDTIEAALVEAVAAERSAEGAIASAAPPVGSVSTAGDAVPTSAMPYAGTERALAAEREWVARVEGLEARLEEQDTALRRVLGLLVDWVEGDRSTPPQIRSVA